MSHDRAWQGALELSVEVAGTPGTVRALAYPEMVGTPSVGHDVLLNVSALARGLGTGGYALVVACPQDLPADPTPGPGHLIKSRYSPLQALVLGVDEEESDSHEALRTADDVAGMPVISADLHSAVPAIVAGARAAAERSGAPAPRICYVMTDGGALPAWFSRTISGLRESEWLTSVITTGQAFGGDLEAVSVHSGLLAAHHVEHADLVIVAQGPGNLGTGTRWGFSGVSAGEALNAAAILGGRPIGSLRVSARDIRGRHRGISHHSQTALGRVALAACDVVVPHFAGLDPLGIPDNYPEVEGDAADSAAEPGARHPDAGAWPTWESLNALIAGQVDAASGAGRHRVVARTAGPETLAALAQAPVALTTMGRGLDADPSPFLAAAVAGEFAYDMSARRTPSGGIWADHG